MSEPRIVVVTRPPIELCQFIKLAGVTQSGGEAKQLVRDGLVHLNGEVETRKGRKLENGDKVTFDGHTLLVRVQPAG